MCCVRFDIDVLLVNIFGSPQYKDGMEIPIQQFIKKYCGFLNDIIPGYTFFETSKDDIDDCVRQYNAVFRWKDDHKDQLQAKADMLNRDKFNQIYPDTIAKKLCWVADICLGAWNLRQQ